MNTYRKNNTPKSHKQEQPQILIGGLIAAGKTTVFHLIQHGKSAGNTSINGTKFEIQILPDETTTLWAYGGRCLARPLWQEYYENAQALIFVIDSNDRDRIEEVRLKLYQILYQHGLKDKPLLILANKQDLPNAMKLDELREKLGLNKLDENIKWHLQATSAIKNKGLKEGFEWLASTFKTKTKTSFMTSTIEVFNDMKKVLNKFVQS